MYTSYAAFYEEVKKEYLENTTQTKKSYSDKNFYQCVHVVLGPYILDAPDAADKTCKP